MLFRRVTGKNLDDVLAIPTLQGVVAKATSDLASRLGPTRLLGYDAQMMPVVLSEEEREAHIHILGAPGEGKSKFIELLVRGDIERGYILRSLPADNNHRFNLDQAYTDRFTFEAFQSSVNRMNVFQDSTIQMMRSEE